MQVDARLRLTPTSYEHAIRLNRDQMLAEKLQDSFLADFNIKFEQKDDEIVKYNLIQVLLSSINSYISINKKEPDLEKRNQLIEAILERNLRKD